MSFEKLEQLRQKANKKHKLYLSLALTLISILLLIIFIMMMTDKNNPTMFQTGFFLPITVIIVIVVVMIYLANKNEKIYSKAVKETLIEQIVDKKFDELDFKVKSHISKETINRVGIFQKPSAIYGEDHLKGKYQNVRFEVSDLRLDQSSGDSTHTYFRGRWFIFTFNKNFQETIKIVNGPRLAINTKGLQKEETESTKFNKKYHFYASNKLFFYQFMTPMMIDTLSNFYEKSKGKISFALIDNQFHIAMHDNIDFLKIDIKKPITEAIIENLKKDVMEIINIIDELGFNSNKFN